MEHTISLHDSTPEPSPEPFEVSSSYDNYEEPTPLHAFVAAEPVSDGWVQEEVPAEDYEPTVDAQHAQYDEPVQYDEHVEQHQNEEYREQPEIHAVADPAPAAEAPLPSGQRRVVLQLTDGQTVELRRMWDADEAVAFARDAVRRIAAAEAAGEWPDLDGRFLRPDSIFSVDVQAAE